MTWRTFKIIYTFKSSTVLRILFELDDYINYKDGESNNIFLVNSSPYNTWGEGDYLEINLDEIRLLKKGDKISTNRVVRKVTSTNIITARGSSSDIVVSPSAVNYMKSQEARELAREMSRMVDDTGKEVEYKIQVENKEGKKISHSLILRITIVGYEWKFKF